MSPAQNWSSLKRNITRRVRQALQELQESLGNLEHVPVPGRGPVPVRVPVRVPVPARNGGRGGSSLNSFVGIGGLWSGRSCLWGSPVRRFNGSVPTNGGGFCVAQSTRFFSTYNRFGGFNSWRWARINQSVLFQNFSSKTQFRSRSFHKFYKTPTLTQLLKKKGAVHDENKRTHADYRTVVSVAKPGVPAPLRLNISLTQKFHDLVMDLARPAGSECSGCYVDFRLEPRILIPASTMLNGDVMRELMANLKRFERHVAELQRDLHRLSELGELPLKFVASENVIRVFFPNCDREQLESLLVEKNVVSGVVYEDVSNRYSQLAEEGAVSSVSEFDILSSCDSMSSGLSSSDSESVDGASEILSGSLESSEERIVHVEPVTTSHRVDIADEMYWA